MKIWREYYLQADKCPSLPETHGTGFPLKVIDLTDALILHFQPSELWGNINFCCSSHLICDALFLHLQGMNTAVCVWVFVCVCVHTQSLLTLWLFAIPWTVTHQAFLSMGFSWQELLEWVAISYSRGASWSSDQTRSSALQVDSLPTEPPGNTVLLWIMDVRGWNWRQEKQFWEKLIPKLIGLI